MQLVRPIRLKKRWRDGTDSLVFEPLEFLERLAALVPAPRFNMIRYSGVLAPAASWRARLAPCGREPEDEPATERPAPPQNAACPPDRQADEYMRTDAEAPVTVGPRTSATSWPALTSSWPEGGAGCHQPVLSKKTRLAIAPGTARAPAGGGRSVKQWAVGSVEDSGRRR